MKSTGNWTAVSLISAGLMLAGPSADAQSLFTERGFSLTRESFSPLPYEHVDPLTGNLLLTFTDLVLPGAAGLDLVIQRSYNSKIYQGYPNGLSVVSEDSWAGVGWSLHFGRLWGQGTDYPSFEMPDGSRHQFYRKLSGVSSQFISRDFWEYDSATGKVRLPNGIVHTLGAIGNLSAGQAHLVTRTEDPFGNRIDVSYPTPVGEAIQSVTQTLGAQTRTVTFQRNGTTGALTSMTYNSGERTRTWIYTQVALSGQPTFTLLTAVQPPEGSPWTFLYTSADPKHMLRKITTPNGGTIDYTYQEFQSRLGSVADVRFLGVRTRITGGRAVVPGTWTFSYAQPVGGARNETYIDEPGGRRLIERFKGVGSSNFSGVPSWQIGLPEFREVKVGSTSAKAETLVWRTPAFAERISDASEALGVPNSPIYLQLIDSRTISVGSSSFRTEYAYHATSFNDYGRPYQVAERQTVGGIVGPTRTTIQTFKYGFTPYIVDRVESETVAVAGESFATRSYGWNLANGFQTSETVLGLTTTFAPTAQGDRASRTDGLGHPTAFTYDWGSLKNTTPPVSGTQTTRVINPDGTVESETRRGFTTTFSYDGLFRQTVVDPQLGNNTVTTYDNEGEFVTTTRGPNVSGFTTFLKTTLDGFGRPVATEDSAGVKTKTTINALGLVTFKSLPYASPASGSVGTTLSYDALDRLTTTLNPDASSTSRAYDGISVTITDEVARKTRQVWQAFGDPGKGRLVSVTLDYSPGSGVTDELEQTTTYTYNALNSLRTVTFPNSSQVARTFTYNTKNQLQSEEHPEIAGLISYTYDAAGRLWTKADPAGTTLLGYDNNDRLTSIDRPGSLDDVSDISYDGSDNRTGFTVGVAGSDVSPRIVSSRPHDGNNRLDSRTDTVDTSAPGTFQFVTDYQYDNNDNLERIVYPSGVVARYEYDAANRVRAVKDLAGTYFYANGIQYHPSGAISQFDPGGSQANTPPIQTFTYDPLTYRPRTVSTGAFSSTYAYDVRGNVKGTTQTLLSPGQAIPCSSTQSLTQCFSYDRLDRLSAITNGPGAGGFTYTPNGDRLSQTTVGSTGTYTYSGSTLRLLTIDGSSVSHDTRGNLTGDPGGTYTHTSENMMRTATTSAATTTYWYDLDNLRKGKVVAPTSGPAETNLYVHGPANALLAEYQVDCAGTARPSRSYVYAGGRLIAGVRPTDNPIAVEFVNASQTVQETTSSVTATIRLTTTNGPLTCPVSIPLSAISGTATAGADFGAATPSSATFAVGSATNSTRTVSVPIINDSAYESDEAFTVVLQAAPGVSVGQQGVHTVTIVSDDPGFTSADQQTQEGNPGSPRSLMFYVEANPVPTTTVSVQYGTDGGAPCPASGCLDYQRTTGTLVFPAGTTTLTFSVPIIGDLDVEGDDPFQVILSNPVGGSIVDGQATGLILNDDSPSFSLTDVTVTEGPSGSNATASFLVVLSLASQSTVTVNWATAPGTATSGADFFASSGTLTFAPGVLSQIATVTVVGDSDLEANETYFVNLSNPVGANIQDGQGVGTIMADDGNRLAIGDRMTKEGNSGTTTVTFSATLTPAASTAVTVDYATADDTATAGSDYVSNVGTLTFAPGETVKTIPVTINGDATQETFEKFYVNLSNAGGDAIIADDQAQGTITNEDGATHRSRLMFHNFSTNRLYRWHMKNGNELDSFNWVTPFATDPGWTVGAMADFDQDAQIDYLWHNVNTGSMLFWYIDGDNLKGFQFLPYTMGPPWRVATTFDANNDGAADVVFYNQTTGVVRVMLHDNATLLGQYDLGTLLPGSGTLRVVSSVDANGDGDDELALYDSATGQVVAWDVNGAVVTGTIPYTATQSTSQAYKLVGTKTDFNIDGKADFLWHNPTPTGIFSVWFMIGTAYLGTGQFVPFTATDPVWLVVGSVNLW